MTPALLHLALVRVPVAFIVAMLLSGCAAQRAKPTSIPTETLPAGIYRVADGVGLSEDELWAEIADARFVLVGESHDSERDHALQLRVVRAMEGLGDVALGMEMFQRPFQAPLDRYVAGEIDEATMLEATQWEERWGFATDLYRPFWRHARATSSPIVALNLRRELTKRIAKVGIAGLTDAERSDLPTLDLTSERHRAWMHDIFAAHGQPMEPDMFERFYQAQVAWDETMAESAVRAATRYPNRQILVLAGRGHVERDFGIPARLRRRTAERIVSIVPLGADVPTFDWMRGERFADYIWVAPDAPMIDSKQP